MKVLQVRDYTLKLHHMYIHEWGESLTRHELYRGVYPLGKKGILNKALHAYPLSSSQNVRLYTYVCKDLYTCVYVYTCVCRRSQGLWGESYEMKSFCNPIKPQSSDSNSTASKFLHNQNCCPTGEKFGSLINNMYITQFFLSSSSKPSWIWL